MNNLNLIDVKKSSLQDIKKICKELGTKKSLENDPELRKDFSKYNKKDLVFIINKHISILKIQLP